VTEPNRVAVEFDEFGWSAVLEEAARQNVSPDELIVHATMYYLSDRDSGRPAARAVGGDSAGGGRRARFERD
jgi:hypothetical protein